MAQGWSIIDKTPSTAQSASINSSTGVANFPANPSTTTDNVYTIQYDNGNGCTETTTYTVEKCVPSCTCTASAGGNVQCEASTSLVSVGSYTSNNCSGSWSATHKSGANFLYDFSFSNGTISAKVQQGSTTSTQSGTYTIGIDNCTHDVTFTQEKCTTTCVITDITQTVIPKWNEHNVTVTYKLNGISKSQTIDVSWEQGAQNTCFDNEHETVTIGEGSCTTSTTVTRTGAPTGIINGNNLEFGRGGGTGNINITHTNECGSINYEWQASEDEDDSLFTITKMGNTFHIWIAGYDVWDEAGKAGRMSAGFNIELWEVDTCGNTTPGESFSISTNRNG